MRRVQAGAPDAKKAAGDAMSPAAFFVFSGVRRW